jgi:CRISPR/Cas system CSM-associated protein Csm2 small subunit
MSYNVEDIDKIISFTSWSNKKKIDKLLEIDADLYCNLGQESTKTEIDTVHRHSRRIYKAIKKIDSYQGGLLLREQ